MIIILWWTPNWIQSLARKSVKIKLAFCVRENDPINYHCREVFVFIGIACVAVLGSQIRIQNRQNFDWIAYMSDLPVKIMKSRWLIWYNLMSFKIKKNIKTRVWIKHLNSWQNYNTCFGKKKKQNISGIILFMLVWETLSYFPCTYISFLYLLLLNETESKLLRTRKRWWQWQHLKLVDTHRWHGA